MKRSRKVKRVFETAVALLLQAIVFLLEAVITLLIIAIDGRPVFFGQERVGEGNKIYKMWKFRTMKVKSRMIREEVPLEDDDRVTFLGYWLRKFCLDELPQLWNVLKGDIYLVGTRSEVNDPDKISRYDPEDWAAKLKMPHGITGYWQVFFKGEAMIYDRATIDQEKTYYKGAGFLTDLVLMVYTPFRLLIGFKRQQAPVPVIEYELEEPAFFIFSENPPKD